MIGDLGLFLVFFGLGMGSYVLGYVNGWRAHDKRSRRRWDELW